MKILWSVNIMLPEINKYMGNPILPVGGWLVSLLEDLKKNNEIDKIAVACVYNGKEYKKVELSGVDYYLIPEFRAMFKYSKKVKKYWNEIIEDFNPDVIHIHGTEYCHATPLLDMNLNIPITISIQGMMNEYYKHYYAGMDFKDLFFYRTLRENIFFDGMLESKLSFKKRAKNEVYMIKKTKYVIGRTEWDYCNTKKLNKDLTYFHCNESLRETFYDNEWKIGEANRHNIYISQAAYPIKGLHFVLEAISYLKDEYPDIKLYIAGKNILSNITLVEKLKRHGYYKYINSIIKKYSLQDNIEFTGFLSEEQVAKKLKESHLFISAAAIENSCNSVGEAQLIGVPTISSYVGGLPSMCTEGKDILFYNYQESAILANKIRQIFEDDQLAINLSNNGRITSLERHSKEKNSDDIIKIYKKMLEQEGK